MLSTREIPEIHRLEARVLEHACEFGRKLPEIRFYILDGMEFISLLEKNVYPVSPVNIWEGKRMVTHRHRIEHGLETSLFYEVVQTGNPSYAYLNHSNSPMMQASVMAHVVGHCEFSELNVLKDSTRDRTEMVMYLSRKVNLARSRMGEVNYAHYWNACESTISLIAPHSQYNLSRSVESNAPLPQQEEDAQIPEKKTEPPWTPFSYTLETVIHQSPRETAWEKELQTKIREETINRRGYKLKAPCQDIFGFIRNYAPTTESEKSLLNYMYAIHSNHDFVIRTQIMNEGWAMYWEKKIMLELFREKSVTGIIDYARVFSGVCLPRPYYQRNPYHLGFYLWNHIEQLYREGKVSLEYHEETDQATKNNWRKESREDPLRQMEHLIRTVTDYEFLRRFLSPELIEEFSLNRIPKVESQRLRIPADNIIREEGPWVWVDPVPIKKDMLNFFTHFHKPRIYAIDADFQDGGLLLYHRDDGRRLRKDWIKPTLKNLNLLWKAPVYLVSRNWLYSFSANLFKETVVTELSFEKIVQRMKNSEKPFKI